MKKLLSVLLALATPGPRRPRCRFPHTRRCPGCTGRGYRARSARPSPGYGTSPPSQFRFHRRSGRAPAQEAAPAPADQPEDQPAPEDDPKPGASITAEEDEARMLAYGKAVWDMYLLGLRPDGEELERATDLGPAEGNRFAIADVNGDGAE